MAEYRKFEYDKTTVATLWAFSFVALLIIITRLSWRYHRGELFFREDFWMAFAVLPLMLRLAFMHITLINGTAYFNHKTWGRENMNTQQIDSRVLGSQMSLPGRVCYASFVWCMKVCILLWFEKVAGRVGRYGIAIKSMKIFVALSYIGVVVSTFCECRPVRLYWQVWPDAGTCVKATAQLLTMGVLNIATDLGLMVIPLPLIYRARLPWICKLQLSLLFCISFFVISITIIRMPVIIKNETLQSARSLWASIEVMIACIVANAPVFHSFMQTARKAHQSCCQQKHHPVPSPVSQRRKAQLPVTGQDSFGSLTRNDGLVSTRNQTQGTQNHKLDVEQGAWGSEFLGASGRSFWDPTNKGFQMPVQPPPTWLPERCLVGKSWYGAG